MDEGVIGQRIRGLREAAGVTLSELAARAGLSKGTLSKIEQGQISSPISTFIRLAEALGLPLADLFAAPAERPSYALTRRGEGRLASRDGSRFGYAYEALAAELPGKRVEPFLLKILPSDPPGEFQHGGQEFIYMLSGSLRFEVGDEVFELRRGDALYFDPRVTHRTRVVGSRPAEFLCLFIQDDHPPTPRPRPRTSARSATVEKPRAEGSERRTPKPGAAPRGRSARSLA